jgi:hypothetical protein
MEFIEIISKRVPCSRTDVLVVGGGPAGFGAGVAAARNGAKTVILEKYAFLGGMMTSGYVMLLPFWLLRPYQKERLPLINGIPTEWVNELDKVGGTVDPEVSKKFYDLGQPLLPETPSWMHQDMEITKIVMQKMALKAGCSLKLHTQMVDVIMDNNRVVGVLAGTKRGLQAFMAETVIDATGDADVAALAGAPFDQHFGEGILPVTLVFYMGNVVDIDKTRKYLEKDPGLVQSIRKAGLTFGSKLTQMEYVPTAIILSWVDLPKELQSQTKYKQVERKGEVLVWALHIHGKDVTNPDDLTNAELEARENIDVLANFLKNNVPGFENSYICSVAPQIGTRESRRITGYYRLTSEDVNQGKRFEDGVLRCLKGGWRLEDWEKQKSFDIPFRCLAPVGIEGLLVAGRPISIDHPTATFLSPRDVITCMGLGEAVGTAAAIAFEKGILCNKIDIKLLRDQLVKQGVNLGE